MAVGSKIVGFIRSIFTRDKEELQDAAGGASTSDLNNIDGNYALGTMGYTSFMDHLQVDNALMARYVDYERMDEYSECSAALDIYSDDSTVMDSQMRHVLWTECEDGNIQEDLNSMFWNKVKVDSEAWETVRMLCKYGSCLPRGTRIWTVKGLKEIQNVGVGDLVVSRDDKGKKIYTEVVHRYENGVKEIYRVKTRHRELRASGDHKVLVTTNQGCLEWVAVKDIKCERYPGGVLKTTNSHLAIATEAYEGHDIKWADLVDLKGLDGEYGDKGTPHHIQLTKTVEPWFCRLLGYMIGNGWVTHNKYGAKVSLALSAHACYNDLYKEYFSRFGVPVNDGKNYFGVHSVELARLFKEFGWINGAAKKRVPSWVFMLPVEHREEFLNGFIDADGWATNPETRLGGAFHFEIANIELARDLKQLIDGLGYRSGNIRERIRSPEGVVINGSQINSSQPAYTLTFDKVYLSKSPFTFERVIDLEKVGKEEVFDLEIGHECHNFVAEGFVVHNSAEEILVNDGGVQGLNFLPAPTVRRLEDKRNTCVGYAQSFKGHFNIPTQAFGEIKFDKGVGRDQSTGVVLFEPWRIAFMRLRSTRRRAMYGLGMLEAARWIWKRLVLLEDAALISRLSRAPSRFAFYIDVGRMSPEDAEKYLHAMSQRFKKNKFVDPRNGKLNLRYNPLCLTGDTKIPLLDGRTLSMLDLVSEHEAGKENWTYAIDRENNNRVVPGKISWAGGTRKNASLVEVELDNGERIKCTPDHKFMLRDGSYQEARFLASGTSLMPWREVDLASEKDCQMAAAGGNHRVIMGRWLEETEDTYTLTIEKYHNFAVSAGVFIKNSSDEDLYLPVRDSKEVVRADVLNTPTWTGVEDIEYFRAKLFAALKVPKSYLGYDENMPSRATLCLAGGTKIPLLDGSEKTIKQMADDGGEYWVYSVNKNGKIITAKAISPRLTRPLAVTVIVELDNGKKITCTPDHPFMMADGTYVDAGDLNTGDDLMPFNQDACKVKEVWAGGMENTYDIEVPEYHNFAVSAGVFVHNSAEDVRFGRAVLRVQNEYRSGMRHVAQVHLAARGIDPAYVDFNIKMAIPSSIFELAQLEVQNTRSQFAQSMEMFVSKHWILSRVFGLSDQEIEKIFDQRKQEQKAEAGGGQFESIDTTGNPGGTAAVQAISVPNQAIKYRSLPARNRRPEIEKQIFSGNREHEKKLEHELGRILSEQRVIGGQVARTNGFMNELKAAMRASIRSNNSPPI